MRRHKITRETEVYLLRYKSEFPSAYRKYKASKERPEDGRVIRRLHTDGAAEYLGHAFQEGLSLEETSFSYSTAYSQQQNGQAERLNRTILDKATAMMKACGLPPSYWSKQSNIPTSFETSLQSQHSLTLHLHTK